MRGIICFGRVKSMDVVRERCPTCSSPSVPYYRAMVQSHEKWYGFSLTCLRCGESWEDGEMRPRPFAPRWREHRVASTKARLRRWRAGTLPQGCIPFGGEE